MRKKNDLRWLIYTAYLLPMGAFLLQLVWGFIPHLYFVYKDQAHKTLSLYGLMSNTFSECREGLSSQGAEVTAFSYTMLALIILAWALFLLYGVFAVLCAVMSVRAFRNAPTSRESNRAKRWLHLLCPGRVMYVVFCLFPLLISFIPPILSYLYDKQLWMKMKVFYLGPGDYILSLFLAVLSIGGFLATLQLQSRERMDMFRLYKSKK